MMFGLDLVPCIMAACIPEDERPACTAIKDTTRRKFAGAKMRHRVGDSLALQPGRGRHQIARIIIDDAWVEPLGRIDDAEARREGFGDRAEFFTYWVKLYGEVNPRELVEVYRFHLDPATLGRGLREEARPQRLIPDD